MRRGAGGSRTLNSNPPTAASLWHTGDFPSRGGTGGGDDAERRPAPGTRLLLPPSFSSPADTLWGLDHVGAEAEMASGTRCRKVPPPQTLRMQPPQQTLSGLPRAGLARGGSR